MKKILAIISIAILMIGSGTVFAKEANSPIIRKTVSTITNEKGEIFTGEIITYKPYQGSITKSEQQQMLAKVLYYMERDNFKPTTAIREKFFSYALPESTGRTYNIDVWENGFHYVGTLHKTHWLYSKNGESYFDYCGWVIGYNPNEVQPYFDKVTQ